jgi:isoquinoline 1-oxidoreductase beta subunit
MRGEAMTTSSLQPRSPQRREFLRACVATGGGLALEFSFPFLAAAAAGEASVEEVNAWVVIHPDDRVVIRIARSEMGQGSLTALAQLVAEELDCEWAKVSTEFASPNENLRRKRVWGSMSTGGSRGVRDSQDYVRKAGAAAREMLIAAAAVQWKVPAAECSVDKGVVTHSPTGRTLRYGELAAAAARIAPPKDIKLRDPVDWKIAGKPFPRLDIPDKVLGKPVFGTDVVLPGMLHASIAQCPVFGGKLKSVDATEAEGMRGVKKVVSAADFVAVVADSWWRAQRALGALKIEWDFGADGKASDATIEKMLRDGLDDPKAAAVRTLGDTAAALAGAAKVVEAEYSAPYLAHATMEPQVCTAWVKPDGFVEVWTSTQNGEASLAAAAQAAGVAPEKAEVHKTMLGGGFGRRGAPQDFVRQGVTIAKAMPGTPVKLMWSREEDMQHDFYRPASIVKLRAGLDAEGTLVGFEAKIACPSILAVLIPRALRNGVDFTAVRTLSDMPYSIANQRIDYAMRNGHVPVGFWRAPGQQNGVYRECFIDELAHAAGVDPLAFRLAMLEPGDRNLRVLETVAKAAGWGRMLPAGVGRGVAVVEGFGSYAAGVAEVSIAPDGGLKVLRYVVAIDSGYFVNPDSCAAQAESNAVYGLGGLFEACSVKDGRIEQSNFHDFRLPVIGDMPKVELVLVPSGGFWGGHGEPGILPFQAAVLNAVFALTGKRIRRLPLRKEDLRAA